MVCKSTRLRPGPRIVVTRKIRQGYKDHEYIEFSLLEAGQSNPKFTILGHRLTAAVPKLCPFLVRIP